MVNRWTFYFWEIRSESSWKGSKSSRVAPGSARKVPKLFWKVSKLIWVPNSEFGMSIRRPLEQKRGRMLELGQAHVFICSKLLQASMVVCWSFNHMRRHPLMFSNHQGSRIYWSSIKKRNETRLFLRSARVEDRRLAQAEDLQKPSFLNSNLFLFKAILL